MKWPRSVGATSSFMEHCWILVGMMGVGKSAVGRELSKRTGREFLDTDHLLQLRLCRPVSQLFHIYGEEAFRQHETALLRSLEPTKCILSTGGGIVTREENWIELHRLGNIVYLKATEDELIARLANSKKKRPLLEVEDWQNQVRQILAAREPLYQQADVVVHLEGDDIAGAADKTLQAFTELSA